MNDARPTLSESAAGGTPWFLLFLLVLLPLWNHPYFEELKSPNPLSRTYLTRALFDHHTVAITPVERTFGDVMDRSRRGNQTYCDKAPGSSFLLLPVYAALRINHSPTDVTHQKLLMWGSIMLGVLPTFFALACLHAILVMLAVSWNARRIALIAMGLGCVGVPFELLFFGHQLAACFVMFTIWAGLKAARSARPSWALLAGFFAGWSVIIEYPALLLILIVAAWCVGSVVREGVLVGERLFSLVFFVVLGSLPPLLLGMAYHDAAFGGPLTTGYAFIENPYFANIHNKGLMGIQLPTLQGLGGTLFSSNRGLFYFEPWALLWPVGCVLLMRSQRKLEGTILVVAGVLYICFAAGFGYWLGGWSLGPRHLVPSQPFFLIAFAVAFNALDRTWAGVLVRALVVWSVVVIGLACATHSGYPEEFIHPFFQMTLPLARAGFFPYSVGTMLGWSRQASAIVPLSVVTIAVLWVALMGRRIAQAPATLVAASLLIVVMGSLVRHTNESTHRLAWIMDTVWEPRMTTETKRPDPVKQMPGFAGRPVRQDERNHVGRHYARTNDPAKALEYYVQGIADAQAGRP